ncbi:MAG TPA: hypothetical protein VMF64_04370 [Steroidobacteraceae bacterium]|nr:hypothetical protein [Steroidobacteraceae bacterium]
MDSTTQSTTTKAALPPILIAAVIQGVSLYALQHAIEVHAWPSNQLGWLLAFYGVALFCPVTFELLVEHRGRRAFWVLLALLGAVMFYFGWHHGNEVVDPHHNSLAASGAFFVLPFVVTVWWLQVLPFLQNRLSAGRWTMDYRLLFTHAWRNIITLAEAGLFAGLFWLILGLWMSLFHMIGIDLFRHLFTKPAFAYLVTSIAFGCALLLIGSIDRIVSAVLEQLLNVLKWLAPLAGLLLALFTLALAARLPGLIATGSRAIGAVWLLWLVAVVVLLVNAAYRDGTVECPYPNWLARALRICVPLTVIISITALYALGVRAAHYGLSVERVWAFIVAGAALMYSLGYSRAAFRTGPWLQDIARVNVVVALLLLAAIAAALTPLFSPYRLAAASQSKLILEGRYGTVTRSPPGVSPFRYLAFDAGQYGRRRLEQLAQLHGGAGADEIRDLARQALAQKAPGEIVSARDAGALVANLSIYPAGRKLDPELARLLVANWGKPQAGMYFAARSDSAMAGVFVDLDGDGVDEFVLLMAGGGPAYQHLATGWRYIGRLSPDGPFPNWQALLQELTRGNLAAVTPRWKELSVGPHRFRVTQPP